MAQVVVWQTRKFSDADFDTLVNTVNVWLYGGDVDQSRMFIQYMNNGLASMFYCVITYPIYSKVV